MAEYNRNIGNEDFFQRRKIKEKKTPDTLIKPLIPKNGGEDNKELGKRNGAESYDYPDPVRGLQGEMPEGGIAYCRTVCGIGKTNQWIGWGPPILSGTIGMSSGPHFPIGGESPYAALNPPGAGGRLVIIEPDLSLSNPKDHDFFQPIGPGWQHWNTGLAGTFSSYWYQTHVNLGYPGNYWTQYWPFNGTSLLSNNHGWPQFNSQIGNFSTSEYDNGWMSHCIMKVVPRISVTAYPSPPPSYVIPTTITNDVIMQNANNIGWLHQHYIPFNGGPGDNILFGLRVPQTAWPVMGGSNTIQYGWPMNYPGAPFLGSIIAGTAGGVLPLDMDYLNNWVFSDLYFSLCNLMQWPISSWVTPPTPPPP